VLPFFPQSFQTPFAEISGVVEVSIVQHSQVQLLSQLLILVSSFLVHFLVRFLVSDEFVGGVNSNRCHIIQPVFFPSKNIQTYSAQKMSFGRDLYDLDFDCS
jgi:hypothetical protein